MTITIRTDFGTDHGPPCTCGGTVYTYEVNRNNIKFQCNGCHTYGYLRVQDKPPTTAEECSALHRGNSEAEKSWQVTYETRHYGAIGIYQPRTWRVFAPDQETALANARRELNVQGYDTRNPVACKQLPN